MINGTHINIPGNVKVYICSSTLLQSEDGSNILPNETL